MANCVRDFRRVTRRPANRRFGAGQLVLALAVALALPAVASASQTSTLVQFNFGSYGNVMVDLFNDAAPLSVANFLQNYVNTGLYNNSIIHRVTHNGQDGIQVVQGGGFDTSANLIPTAAPIALEYSIPNTAGTLAMARTGIANSATSQWFFNDTDNSAALAPNATSAGYAVFGHVLSGMNVLDTISNLPFGDFSKPIFFGKDALTALPVATTYTETDYNNHTLPTVAQLVVVQSVTVISTHAAWQNPVLVNDVNNDGALSPQDLAILLEDITNHSIHSFNTAFTGANYLDVTGDGLISPADVLALVDAFRAQAAPQSLVVPLAVVPEPGSLALAAAGLVALGGYAVRRRRKLGSRS